MLSYKWCKKRSSLNFHTHIFNMSMSYMQSIKKDKPKALEGVDFTKYHYQPLFNIYMSVTYLNVCTFSRTANTIQLGLQSGITLTILILQHIFSYQTYIFQWLMICASLIKIRQKLNKLFNKNLEMLKEGRNDGRAE